MEHKTSRYWKRLRFGYCDWIFSISIIITTLVISPPTNPSSICVDGAFLLPGETPRILARTRGSHIMSMSTNTGEIDGVRGAPAASTGDDCPGTGGHNTRREGLRLVMSDFHHSTASSESSLPTSVWTDCGDALLGFLLDHREESPHCRVEEEGVIEPAMAGSVATAAARPPKSASAEALSVADRAAAVAERFLRMSASSSGSVGKLETRQALRGASRSLLLVGNKRGREPEPERDQEEPQRHKMQLPASTVLSVSSVMAALALGGGEERRNGVQGEVGTDLDRRASSRAAASAIASTVSDLQCGSMRIGFEGCSDPDHSAAVVVANGIVRALLVLAGGSAGSGSCIDVDLHIVTSLARALGVDGGGGFGDAASHCEVAVSDAAVSVIRRMLMRLDDAEEGINGSGGGGERPAKAQVAASLALAAQVRPWRRDLSPVRAIEAAVLYDLWHAAERVCQSAVSMAAAGRGMDGDGVTSCIPNEDSMDTDDDEQRATAAVHALIDAAFEAKSYRRADAFATEFYSSGGRSRFVEARFCHACSTIAKLLRKGAVQVIEVQVARVDQAAARVAGDAGVGVEENTCAENKTSPPEESTPPGEKIRTFALHQLEEAGDFTSAHRLAGLWGMEYVYDERVLAAAAEARRRKYLQWEDVVPNGGDGPPDVASTPEGLRRAFKGVLDAGRRRRADGEELCVGRFGFDVEWGSDHGGAALLQIATADGWAVLVDVPALSGTADGVEALRDTVGRLFASPSSRRPMIGFGCRHDLARLRSSPCVGGEDGHWLDGGTSAVVELRHLVAEVDPEIGRFGLSRVCARYVGKPLDKSEQCSLWTARPLSEEQRVYAALDAWVCAAIHERLLPSWAPA